MKPFIDWFKKLFQGPRSKDSEKTKQESSNFDNIFVGEVLSVAKHPNADRLKLAQVKVGDKIVGPIVCGGPNLAQGQKVAIAFIGAKLIDQHDPEKRMMTLGKAKIRGVESQGMICSELELGLGNDRAGIMVLDSSLKSGVPLTEALNL